MRGFEKESGSIPGQVVPGGGVRVGDLSALLARVEAAKGSLYLTPGEAYRAMVAMGSDTALGEAMRLRKALAGSLDAALALHQRVLPGWTVASISQQDDKSWFVELREGYLTSYGRVAMSDTRPKTPALALLAAMLEALGARAASPGEGPSLATDEPK